MEEGQSSEMEGQLKFVEKLSFYYTNMTKCAKRLQRNKKMNPNLRRVLQTSTKSHFCKYRGHRTSSSSKHMTEDRILIKISTRGVSTLSKVLCFVRNLFISHSSALDLEPNRFCILTQYIYSEVTPFCY